jgi:hypothetical protein
VATPQATVESTIPLTLQQGGCDLQFTSGERTLSLTKLEDKIAAAHRHGHQRDRPPGPAAGALRHLQHPEPHRRHAEHPGLVNRAMTDLNARLSEMAAPMVKGSRTLIAGPRLNGNLVRGLAGLFNSPATIGKQNNNGMLVPSFGLKVGTDQNVDTHVNGTQVVTGTAVNGANQTGSNIVTSPRWAAPSPAAPSSPGRACSRSTRRAATTPACWRSSS